MATARVTIGALLLLATCALVTSRDTPAIKPGKISSGAYIGPSTNIEPYLLPATDGITIFSLLTVNDTVPLTSDPTQGYPLVGIPDGMGAYLQDDAPDPAYAQRCSPVINRHNTDRASSTFTLLLNHELGRNSGIVRRHGSRGAFVSEYIIDRSTYRVVSGEDLIRKVVTWNPNTRSYSAPGTYAFERFCSADLPAVSAFFDAKTGAGTQDRIFMNGEETTGGRAFAHVATGSEKGTTYELPRMGKGGWENQVACPHSGAQTVVVGLDDSTDGQVYVYIGEKQTTGSVIDKAGLTNGQLYGIKVPAFPLTPSDGKSREPTASRPLNATVDNYGPFNFTLEKLNNDGDVRGLAQGPFEAVSDAAGVTRWFRPEDGSWDPVAGKDGSATFYFATTASFTARSRTWQVVFNDINVPTAGGTVTAVVEGSELAKGGAPKMVDNMVATCDSSVYLQEDPGRNNYLARIWRYHPEDGLIHIAEHNPHFFAPDAAQPLTLDEESSGIIAADGLITNMPSQQCFIVNTQAHYPIAGALVEGAQLMLMCVHKQTPKNAKTQSPIAA